MFGADKGRSIFGFDLVGCFNPVEKISQIGFPQVGLEIKNV